MSYIDRHLMLGERVVYRTRLHWVVFLPSAISLLAAVIILIATPEVSALGWVLVGVAIVTGISAFVNYYTSEFGVTNKRVWVKLGLIQRSSFETLLTKVEGIQVDQSIWGRLLGYGSIVVSGTGGSKERFHKINNPLEFRTKVSEQVEAPQSKGPGPS